MSGMEVLAIIAFIPALIDLGKYSVHFTKQLHAYHKDAGVLDREIEYYGCQIDEFASVTEIATQHLKHHHERYPKSLILRQASEKKILSILQRRRDSVADKLQSIESGIKTLQHSRFKTVRYFRWQRHCQDILDLIPQMDSIKKTINLLVEISRYESLEFEYKRVDCTWGISRILELREDLEFQQNVIKVQLDIIQQLWDQLKHSKLDVQSRKHDKMAVLNLGKQVVTRDITGSFSSDDSTSDEDSDGGGPSAPRRPNGPRPPRKPRGPWRPRRPNDSDGPKTGPLVPSAGASVSVPDATKPKDPPPVVSSDGGSLQWDDSDLITCTDTESDASTPAAAAAATSPISTHRTMTNAAQRMNETMERAKRLQKLPQSVPNSQAAFNAKVSTAVVEGSSRLQTQTTLADKEVLDIAKKVPCHREKVLVYA